jgi:hypothetical protein
MMNSANHGCLCSRTGQLMPTLWLSRLLWTRLLLHLLLFPGVGFFSDILITGGVMDGGWWIGSSSPAMEAPLLPPLPVPISWVLHHILSSVQRGPGTNPPPHDKVLWVYNSVSPFGLLPADQPDFVCICPLVFGQSSAVENRWIQRPLLFSELLQAFDI